MQDLTSVTDKPETETCDTSPLETRQDERRFRTRPVSKDHQESYVRQKRGRKLLRHTLSIFPDEVKTLLFQQILDAIDYEPVIGVMGKCGGGKSKLCNTLFKGDICAVSDVEACTREVQELKIKLGHRSLKILDIPGVGESTRRDEEYEMLYRKLMPELDLILWVIKGDDRAFSSDEYFYNNVIIPAGCKSKVLFVLNQVDKVEPCHEWDRAGHLPSPAQQCNIEKKTIYLAEQFNVSERTVIAVSASEGYNILHLVEAAIKTLPAKAKSGVTGQLKNEYVTEEVQTEARNGFGDVISALIESSIDILPIPEGVKSVIHKGKDFIVDSIKSIWNYFFL